MAIFEESERGRYVILGTIDGILAVLGIIIGLSSANLGSGIIIKAALGGGIALCLTNSIGSYLAESAVEYGKLSEVEQALLQDLKHTRIEKMARRNIIVDALLSGGSSFLGSLIPISPFVFFTNGIALDISITLAMLALVILGVVVVIVCSVLRLSP